MNRLKAFYTHQIFYPLLCGIVCILNVLRNDMVSPWQGCILLFIIIVLSFVYLSVFISYKIGKNREKSAFFSVFFIGFNLFYYYIFRSFIDIPFINTLPKPMYFFLGLSVLFFSALIYWLIKTKYNFTKINAYFNFIFTAFVFIELIKWTANIPCTIPLAQKTFSPKGKLLQAAGKPNIYYIIFDSYTSSESLRRYWQYDNTPFEDSLRNLGFFLTKNCKTNYDFTPYCMASYLNGSDLDLSNYRSKNELNREPFNNTFDLIKQSNVATYLNGLGYKTVNYSLFDVGAEKALFFSMWHDDGVRDATLRSLLNRTLWQSIYAKYEFYTKPNTFVKEDFPNMKVLKMLGDSSLAQQKQPVFVYAHVMMPHFPFCFDENGNRLKIDTKLTPEAQFLGQLRYTNTLALKVVRQILANEKGKQPLIIIQGDHGYRQLFNIPLEERRREAHSIFNAYRVPALMQPQLNDTIRPIEGFQKLF